MPDHGRVNENRGAGGYSCRNTAWREALGAALRSPGVPAGASAFAETREDARVSCDPERGVVSETRLQAGLALRIDDSGAREAAWAGVDPDEGAELVGRFLRGAGCAVPATASTERADPEAPGRIPVREVAQLVAALHERLQRRLPGASRRVEWSAARQSVVVARADGFVGTDQRATARVRLSAQASDLGAIAFADRTLSSPVDVDAAGLESAVEEIAQRLRERTAVVEGAGGEMPVVFAPAVGGVVIHELVGHPLEADHVTPPWWSELPTTAPGWQVIDDPRRGRAPWTMDDEGEDSRAVPLFRRGLSRRIHTRHTAATDGEAPTGHGRRASFRDAVLPRMGCTFLSAGRDDPEEMVADLSRGLYVRRLRSARVDTLRGEAWFVVDDADWIDGGRRRPAPPCLLWLSAVSALSTLDRVAGDLTFDVQTGRCLKRGQPLVVSVGAPTFRIGSAQVKTK